MRHTSGGTAARAGAAVLLTVALAACSGGSGGDDGADGPTSGDSQDGGAVSTADLESMHESVHHVGELIDEASRGAGEYQQVVAGVHHQHPEALLTDPDIRDALAAQQERQDARDDAVAALADEPAMADPEVAEAYAAFADAGERMFAFQDGYNASMPEFLHAGDVCERIFDVQVKLDPVSYVPGAFEEQWKAAHEKLTRPCEAALEPLKRSDNVNIRRYVDITERVIRERNAAMTDIGVTRAEMARSLARLKRANTDFLRRYKAITAFSDELERITAVDEYRDLDGALADELGGEGGEPSGSGSPSGSAG